MKAAVLNKIKDIEVKLVDAPSIKEDEVLIKVHCIGVCGSDIHYYEHGRIGPYFVNQPIILGHELAGSVVKCGAKAKHISVGERVAVEPGVTCGLCQFCKSGRYNLCKKVEFMATPPYDGAWAEYVKVRADVVYRLPDQLSFEHGAMLEPLSVGFHALQRAQARADHNILITGLGPIGQLAQVAAKLSGINSIYGSDVVAFRRDFAIKQGFIDVCNPLTESIDEKVAQWTDHEGFDIVIESSGNPQAIASLSKLVKRGGKIVLVGLSAEQQVPFCTNEIVDNEIDVIGVFRYANTYPRLLNILNNSSFDVSSFITHKFKLDDIQQAIDTSITLKDESMKIMIYP